MFRFPGSTCLLRHIRDGLAGREANATASVRVDDEDLRWVDTLSSGIQVQPSITPAVPHDAVLDEIMRADDAVVAIFDAAICLQTQARITGRTGSSSELCRGKVRLHVLGLAL